MVVIVVDTLRADRLGFAGYARGTSPRLDAWVASGRVFERAWATSPWTLPSFGSLLTGELPARHAAGVRLHDDSGRVTALDPELPSLAERLQGRGWATAGIVNNPWLDARFGLARGFDTWDHVAGDNARIRRADEMVDRALAWIDERSDRRFLLLLHLFDPHMDYDAPPPYRGRFTAALPSEEALPVRDFRRIRAAAPVLGERERRFIGAAYDEEVAFVDAQLGRLLDGLDRRGVLRDGLVVFTSDHGEELFEHRGFEHGHALWEEVLRVPLVFWGRGVEPGREPAPASLVDVTPTILDAVGVPLPAGVEGVSLWGNLRRGEPLPPRTLFAEEPLTGSLRRVALRWPHKLEVEIPTGRRRLFALDADPGESRLAGGDHPRAAARLQREVEARFQGLGPRGAPEAVRPRGALERRLRALGYLD